MLCGGWAPAACSLSDAPVVVAGHPPDDRRLRITAVGHCVCGDVWRVEEDAMATAERFDRRLRPDQRNAFLAAFLGWTMDAFDYFIVVLVYAEIAKDFHVSLEKMAFLTTVTLIMRPVGALIFGIWADRRGRRIPLMADVVFYSVVGF